MGLFSKSSPKKTSASASPVLPSPSPPKEAVKPESQKNSPVPPCADTVAPLPENKEPLFLNETGLQELTRKLKETQGSNYTESTRASSKYTDLRYVKYTIAGLPGVKHAVFIPDTLKLTDSIMEQVCGALGKEVPSMLVSGMSSLCHPAKMSTPQLRKCHGFRQLMSDSKSSLGIPNAQKDDRSSGCCCAGADDVSNELSTNDAELTNKQLIDVANRVLEKKVACMISNFTTAAHRLNVWTLTGPRISNFEIFLQQSHDSGDNNVYRMAVAHLQDRAYMECEHGRELLKSLFDKSTSMSPETVDRSTAVSLQGDLWNHEKNSSHREFQEHGFDFWSFESYDDEMSRGHPITQWPWPHADLTFFFYHEEPALDGSPTSDADWEFVTKKRLDLESIPFAPELLAPVGYVIIGGNELHAKKRVLHAMRVASPIMLFDNTPNAPKQLSLFVNVVRKVWEKAALIPCLPFLAEGAHAKLGGNPTSSELLEAMLPSKILNHIEKEFDNAGMDENEKLTLSDIVGLMDVIKRRPQVFKETVCVVDPLHSAPDKITPQLVTVMSSSHAGASEVGSTAVHRSLVVKGWRLHRKLARRAAQLRHISTAIMVAIASVMVASTTLAVSMVHLRLKQARNQQSVYNVSASVLYEKIEVQFTMTDELGLLKILLLVLPIAAGLLTTLQSHFQLSQKWGCVHMASHQVVSDIYHFLGNIEPYSKCVSGTQNQRIFMKRLQDNVRHLAMAGVHEDDLMDGEEDDDGFPQDAEALEQHINQYLYGIRPPSFLWRASQECMASLGGCGPSCAWTALLMDGQEARDMTVPVTGESYMDMRIVPLRKHLSEWAHRLTTMRLVLNILLVISLSVGSGLGASGFSLWIPVTLALATFVTTLTHWLSPTHLLSAVNLALTNLNNLDLRWQGSDVRESRSEATKKHLITMAERLSCSVAASYSGAASIMPECLEDDYEVCAKQSESRGGKRADRRLLVASSRPVSGAVTPYGRSGAATPRG